MQPILLDIYDASGQFMGIKSFRAHLDHIKSIIEWLRDFYDKKGETIAYMRMAGSDIQHNNTVNLSNTLSPNDIKKHLFTPVSVKNIVPMCVYFSVRHCIKATWINDRDQFYAPFDATWQTDSAFLGDCLVFMLFHPQNRISTAHGPNHFIPFKEKEVQPKGRYACRTLLDFLEGKHPPQTALFAQETPKPTFSPAALSILQAGRKLYSYYHAQEGSNPNASLYDIKEFFSGRDAKGKLNPPSIAKDAHYKTLYTILKDALESLAQEIAPQVWEYGFLREWIRVFVQKPESLQQWSVRLRLQKMGKRS